MGSSEHPTTTEPVAAWATDCRDKYAENHDSGYAGRICMADGNLAWAAVIADGCGGSMEGLKVSALAIQAFVEAVRTSTLAELADPVSRETWMRAWTKALHTDAFSRFKGGMSTFCGAVLLPPTRSDDPAIRQSDWTLFTLKVGDSQVLRLTGDGKCMGITPDAPPNNANVEGHNPIRVVGVAPKADFALLDMEEFPLPSGGPCWILAGSDGFFSKKRGKDELCIFSSGDLRDVCLSSGAPFQELPALAIRRSLANAQKLGCAEMMDNATVAMLGFRVPATDLSAAVGGGESLRPKAASGPAGSVPALPASAPAARPQPLAASKPGQTAPAAQSAAKRPGAAPGGRRPPTFKIVLTAVIALVFGLLLGRSCAPSREVSPSAGSQVESQGISIPSNMLPEGEGGVSGRCTECWKRYKAGEITEITNTYHFASECKGRTGTSK